MASGDGDTLEPQEGSTEHTESGGHFAINSVSMNVVGVR
jgi:hypothetical protein